MTMGKLSKLRGHNIIFVDGKWLYQDTRAPTAGNERDCGYCGKANTKEGHDCCLGTLPNVMNACCGHGNIEEAYIQYSDGAIVGGEKAINILANTKE